MEHWKTIADFEAYEVSDLGRVRRKEPTNWHQPEKVRNAQTLVRDRRVMLVLQLYKDRQAIHDRAVHRSSSV